ncbi:MAG: hypothetical protein JSS93_05590 [Bacteroidetes bacterium]|nr:hypothetical protein [Bacteroidota bacterium]
MIPSFFWNSWRKPERIVFYLFVFVALIFILLFWKSWWVTPAPVLQFDNFQQLEKVETISRTFQVGTFKVAVPANAYLIFESLQGSLLQPNKIASYFFISAVFIAFAGFMAVVSSLSRFYFLGGMGLVVIWLAGLGINTLEVFGLSGQAPTIVSVLLFAALGFYFNSYNKGISLGVRLLLFSVVIFCWAGLLCFFSHINEPLLHLSVNELMVGLTVSMVFIIVVAHELVAGAVFIATNTKSTRSLIHFLLLSFFYLANVALLYASKTGLVGWSFLPINSFFLLTLSALLGVVGFISASRQGVLSHEPAASLLYFSLLIVTFATLGFLSATASDMMLDVFEVMVLAAHFACGLIFLVYVIANFGPLLASGRSVHKVLYKPETMPLFTFRIMSLIATFAMISLVASWTRYVDQATATFFNLRGDLYLIQNDDVKAEASYKQSIRYRNQNKHAHYALATIYNLRYESFNEKNEYQKLVELTPDPKAYINLSEIYIQQKNELRGNLLLSDGLKAFPKSAELKNALGLSFLKFKTADSALYYFQWALQEGSINRIAETNYLGTLAYFHLAHSDSASWGSAIDGLAVNRMALANINSLTIPAEIKIPTDTVLNVYQAAYYANFLTSHPGDTALINRISNLSQKPCNDDFSEILSVSVAHALYQRGEVKEALKRMREIIYRYGHAEYAYQTGIWLLEQNNPQVATVYFEKAIDKKMTTALVLKALAITESGQWKEANLLWDSLAHLKNKETATLAVKLKKVLNSDIKKVDHLSEEEKYYFCRYQIPLTDSASFAHAVSQIQNEKLKTMAYLDRAMQWIRWDEPAQAIRCLNRVAASNEGEYRNKIHSLRMMLAAEQRDVVFLKTNAAWTTNLKPYEKAFVEAVLAQADGNGSVALSKFNYLAQANDQFEEGLVAASQFFTQDSTRRLHHFSLLVDGLLAKPHSVKILKQYVVQAALLGLEPEAQEALDKLQTVLPEKLFKKFVDEHPGLFNNP